MNDTQYTENEKSDLVDEANFEKERQQEQIRRQHTKARESNNLTNVLTIFISSALAIAFIFIVSIVIYQKIFSTSNKENTPDKTKPPAVAATPSTTEAASENKATPEKKPDKKSNDAAVIDDAKIKPVITEKNAKTPEIIIDDTTMDDATNSEEINWSIVGKQLILLEEKRQQIIQLMTEKLAASEEDN